MRIQLKNSAPYLFVLLSFLFTSVGYASSSSSVLGSQESIFESLEKKAKNYDQWYAGQIDYSKPENLLSYKDFCSHIKNGDITLDQAGTLVELGSEISNPILFKKTVGQISPDTYCLNFLWIHSKPMKEEGHLFGGNDELFVDKMMTPILGWQKKQPNANMNFWYDSAMGVNIKESVKRTHLKLQEGGVDMTKIKLRDIRDIPVVQQNTSLFSENAAVYFRVDFLKALIADYIFKYQPEILDTIHVDCDVQAICPSHLFDALTVKKLETVGYVFCTTGGCAAENSFIMLRRDRCVVATHRYHLIERVLESARAEKVASLSHNDVFYKYDTFMRDVNQTYRNRFGENALNYKFTKPKAMIAPRTQFGGTLGFTPPQIQALAPALADEEDVALGV